MKYTLASLLALPLLFAASSSYACDDKPCETAYLSSTHQYVANYARQAQTALIERQAHARNRERREVALYNHIHRMMPRHTEPVLRIITPKDVIQDKKPTMI